MSKMIQNLLEADIKKFAKPTRDVEIPRLSELVGEPFVVTLKLLPVSLAEEIESNNTAIKTDGSIDMKYQRIIDSTLMNAVYDSEGKHLFRNKDLQRKFNAKTPIDLINEMLLPSEKSALYGEYTEIDNRKGSDAIVKHIKKH